MIKLDDKNGKSVGVDIGTYSIKVVAVKKVSGENTLVAYNIKRNPSAAQDTQLENLIKEAFEEIDLHPQRINFSISGPDVIVRFVTFPKMSKEQLESALVYEAEKYIPFSINEVVTDFLITGNAAEAGQMKVILAAAKKTAIEPLVKIAEDLGMTIGVIDMNPFAMFNAFLEVNPSLEDKSYTLFDFGHTQTDILISAGKVPCFIRQIQIGGKNIIGAICRDLSISAAEAEEYKLNLIKTSKKTAMNSTISVLDDLIKEIKLSFSYFENRSDKGTGEIYCSGGMIKQEGVFEYLNNKLEVQMKRWNPLENMKISENLSQEDINSVAPQLAVTMGLALRG